MRDLEQVLTTSCPCWNPAISLKFLLSIGKQMCRVLTDNRYQLNWNEPWIQVIADFSKVVFLTKGYLELSGSNFFSEGKRACRCFQMFLILVWGKCFPIKRLHSHSLENSFGNFCFLESGMNIGHEISLRCKGLWTRKATLRTVYSV